jgi:hypothetical protein
LRTGECRRPAKKESSSSFENKIKRYKKLKDYDKVHQIGYSNEVQGHNIPISQIQMMDVSKLATFIPHIKQN